MKAWKSWYRPCALSEAQRGEREGLGVWIDAVDWPMMVEAFESVFHLHRNEVRDRAPRIMSGLVGKLTPVADPLVLRTEWDRLAGPSALHPPCGSPRSTICISHGKLRIPRDGGHDSTLMADSVPASSRTPFHGDGGQHSIWMADT